MRYSQAKTQDLDIKIRELLKANFNSDIEEFKKGIFLTGKTGTGKTHALYAIKNHCKDHGQPCSNVENWVEVLFELKEKMSRGSLKETISNITEKPIVFIDDIGAEKQTEWGQEMLYLIVNRLYEAEKILFLSTNLSFQEFSEKYGDRLTSRILEMCEMKEIIGEDKRIN
jgi:DNA replication protein DnaC